MGHISEKLVKTRTEHQCYACLRVFGVGSELYRNVNVCDDEIYSLYKCKLCHSILTHFDISDFYDGFPDGVVIEAAHNQYMDFIMSGDNMTTDEILEEFYSYLSI